MPEASEIKVKFFEITQKGRGFQARPRSVVLTRRGGIEFQSMIYALRGTDEAFSLEEPGLSLNEAYIRSEYTKEEIREITVGEGLPDPKPESDQPVELCLFSAFGQACVLPKGHKGDHASKVEQPNPIVESGPAPAVVPAVESTPSPAEIADDPKPPHQPEHPVVQASGT